MINTFENFIEWYYSWVPKYLDFGIGNEHERSEGDYGVWGNFFGTLVETRSHIAVTNGHLYDIIHPFWFIVVISIGMFYLLHRGLYSHYGYKMYSVLQYLWMMPLSVVAGFFLTIGLVVALIALPFGIMLILILLQTAIPILIAGYLFQTVIKKYNDFR
tara:strand:- start:1563 stop:2039 length:477 start_codon:yes stop_codon:yes gene_type:complete